MDPDELVKVCRQGSFDLLAITDHQTFDHYQKVADAANSPGRPLVVLPGIEITAKEGVHIIALFPLEQTPTERIKFIGFLEISGSGDTRQASQKTTDEILEKISKERGIVVIPHPFTNDIGFLARARKISTKEAWLESGFIGLMEVKDEYIKYVERDKAGNWVNRYVLNSARPKEIEASTYNLAPINRSDGRTPQEVLDGSTWLRMKHPSILGLKQVACEPRTRISRSQPTDCSHACILSVRVSGGYCDGQEFVFNDALNCIVGPNYAGKSAVLDFIRFVLSDEGALVQESRQQLHRRLYGILGREGSVEVYLRLNGNFYSVSRAFNPITTGEGSLLQITSCPDTPVAYRLDESLGTLEPESGFRFPLEVYEQNRINRLRDDLDRQLEMLDEFAETSDLKRRRKEISGELTQSAARLAPLIEEHQTLTSEISGLKEQKEELDKKKKLLPGEAEQKWSAAQKTVMDLSGVVKQIKEAANEIPDPQSPPTKRESDLDKLFCQILPEVDPEKVAESSLLCQWQDAVRIALQEIESSRQSIQSTATALRGKAKDIYGQWQTSLKAHQREVHQQLSKAGIESPQEVIDRVDVLQKQVHEIESKKVPRLTVVTRQIILPKIPPNIPQSPCHKKPAG